MKRIAAGALALACVAMIVVVPASVALAAGTSYTYADGTLSITGSGAQADYEAGLAPWYENVSDITSVDIADGITQLGTFAFYDCSNVTEVHFASVAQLCDMVFQNYYSQPIKLGTTVYINGQVTNSIEMPSYSTFIGSFQFANWDGLQSIVIPASVTEIKNLAFYDCDNLTDVYFLGTEEMWSNVTIDGSGNSVLDDVTMHYGTLTGHTVSGTVTANGDETVPTVIEMWLGNQPNADYRTMVVGNNTTYTFYNVLSATYTMRVSKADHLSADYTVVVGDSDVTQNVATYIRGDVNMDNTIDIGDMQNIFYHVTNGIDF